MKLLILFLLSSVSICSFASSLSLDIAKTSAIFNRFAIPNEDENRISLPVNSTLTSYRITGFHDLDSGNQLYFLLAPLETHYSFRSKKNFEFDDENFLDNRKTKVNYKFNSYRFGYLWKWSSPQIDYWLGIVGKIRDAKIEVKQSGESQSFDNIGFVPLAAFGFDWKLSEYFTVFSHTDALGSSQGSAYDSQLELKVTRSNYSVSLGKRILGGGADNEKVYNFAQFDSHYLKLSFNY